MIERRLHQKEKKETGAIDRQNRHKIHQMVFQRKHRTQVSDKKDFYFSNKNYSAKIATKTIRIAQEIETEILLITFTRVTLAYVTKCKRTLITKSTSFSELQNHQTPVVKLGLANLYNNFGRILSDPRQLATSHHTQ